MYGPIANIPGYNPNATYLPPGLAAPSSYPEWMAPKQQFYDTAPLPSITQGLGSSGLAADDYPAGGGIAGGIGGPDGKETAWSMNLRTTAKPQERTLSPFDIQPNELTAEDWGNLARLPDFLSSMGSFATPTLTNVSAQEDGQAWITGQPDYGSIPSSWSNDYYQSSFPLQPFDIQPSGLTRSQLDRLGQLPNLPQSEIGDRSWNTATNIAGTLLPFPFSMIPGAIYGGAAGLDGRTLPSDPNAGFLERMIDPREPGMVASGVNWLARQIAGETDAQRSADEAYSKGSVYDTSGAGWVADPSRDAPQVNNEGWSPWYAGQADPYSLTGNMLDQVSAFDFGAGRYADSLANQEWMFGPMARFAQGDRNSTD